MRYSTAHKEQTREKILHSSGALAKVNGFATVGVDGLMSAIGLTGGAFYSHFSSKDELFCTIVERELSSSLHRLSPDGTLDPQLLKRCLNQYLTLAHVQNPQSGCALPALGAEIARGDSAVREQAEHWLGRLQQVWAQTLGNESLAWAMICQCVGALVVARMLPGAELQEQVLAAAKVSLFEQVDRSAAAAGHLPDGVLD